MGVEIQRDYCLYTSDDGNDYSVKLGKDVIVITELGFGAFDASKPTLPRGYKMRVCDVIDATTGRRRRYPVGDPAGAVWAATDVSISVKDKGSATPTAWAVIALIGEHRTIAHQLHP